MKCIVWFLIFENFFRIFVTFVNKEVCEIILIISGSTEYEFSAAIFIELSKIWCKVFTIIMRCL